MAVPQKQRWAPLTAHPKADPEPWALPLSWGTVRAVCAELGGPLLALSNVKQQLTTIPSPRTLSRKVHLHLRPQSRRPQEGKRCARLSQALQGGQSSHRGATSTLGSLETEQGSAYDHSMAQPGSCPSANSSDGLQAEGARAPAKNPRADTGSTKTALLDTEFCLAGSSPGPQPHHFCLDGSLFFSFFVFIFLCHGKDGNMELLVFFWNLQGSHFIFPKVELGQGFPWGLFAVPV